MLICYPEALIVWTAILQINQGGETVDAGGLSAYDRVYLESPSANILTLYVNATGTFNHSALLVNGTQVSLPTLAITTVVAISVGIVGRSVFLS